MWRDHVLIAGVNAAAEALGGDELGAVQAIRQHLHLCLDTCHVAVAGDNPTTDIPQLTAVGAQPSKCQVSSCPAVANPALNPDGLDGLLTMAEPRFCHQTIILHDDKRQRRFADLDQVPRSAAIATT